MNEDLNGKPTTGNTVTEKPVGIGPVETPTDRTFRMEAVDGYLIELSLPDLSLAYTKRGEFRVDISGAIFSDSGFIVEGGYHVSRSARRIRIGAAGDIERLEPDGLWHPCGVIRLVSFVHPENLMNFMGSDLLIATSGSGPAIAINK